MIINFYKASDTKEALLNNVKTDSSVALIDNINLEVEPLIIEGNNNEPVKKTINLNGKTLTGGLFIENGGVVNQADDNTIATDSYGIWAKSYSEVTIDGHGKIAAQDAKYSISVWANGGKVIINNGEFTNAGEGSDLIYASGGGIVEIYGGMFKGNEMGEGVPGTANAYSCLNVRDADYKAGNSNIIVYGGTFYNFNPMNNYSEGPNTNFVANGYTVTLNGIENKEPYSKDLGDVYYKVIKK